MTVTISGTTGIAGVDGSAATPAVQGVDTNTGVFYGTDIVAVSTGGTERMRVNASGQAEFTAGTAALPAITTTGDTNTGIFFPAADTIAFTEGGAEAMRIDSSGQVGIGATPGTILDVYKASGNPYIRVYTGTGSVQAYMQSIDSTYVVMGSLSNHDLGLVTNGTERMRITTGGSLLVGATSVPESARLGVSSTSATAVPLVIQQTAAAATSQNSVVFYRNAAATGTISATATTTAYNTSSDYRLKENVQPMQNALAKIAALKPCTYTWKLDGSLGEGFIAHELAEVVPQAVNGEKNAVDTAGKIISQGVDASFLIATLTAAIQEQQAMITALTNRITALEATP